MYLTPTSSTLDVEPQNPIKQKGRRQPRRRSRRNRRERKREEQEEEEKKEKEEKKGTLCHLMNEGW